MHTEREIDRQREKHRRYGHKEGKTGHLDSMDIFGIDSAQEQRTSQKQVLCAKRAGASLNPMAQTSTELFAAHHLHVPVCYRTFFLECKILKAMRTSDY